MKTIKGIISWYDASSKKGCIWSLDGTPYRIHEFSELKGFKKAPKDGEHVTLSLSNASTHPIIKWVKKSVKKHKLSNKKREPIIRPVTNTMQDSFSGQLVTISGFRVINYHWAEPEVQKDDNKLHAVTGLFSTPEGPLAMWEGRWEKYCGYNK